MDTEHDTAAGDQKTYESLNFYANEQDAGTGDYLPKDEPEQPELGAAEITFILSITFDLVAKRRGEHWKLAEEEAQSLGVATDRVLQKYLPDIQTGPEVALALTGAAILLPRIALDKAAQAEAEHSDGD